MAIFTKQTTEQRPQMRADNNSGDAGLSVIATGMKIVGDVETTGVLKVEGTIEGSIRSARQLLLGRQGQILGDVRATEAIIGGTVRGTVFTEERVEIQGTSTIEGDINTKSIVVLEGATINGNVRMGQQAVAQQPAPANAAQGNAGPTAKHEGKGERPPLAVNR